MAYTHCLMAGMCAGALKKPSDTSGSDTTNWNKIAPAKARCPSSASGTMGDSNFCERKWIEAVN